MVRLEDLCRAVKEFVALLRHEEQLLLVMDRQGIADVTEQKEQVLDEMCRYEQQVVTVLQQLAGSETQEGLWDWLQNVQQPQASGAKKLVHELIGLAHTIQDQGTKNEALVGRTQNVVREAINLIYVGLGQGPVYQGSGALQTPSVLSSVHLHG